MAYLTTTDYNGFIASAIQPDRGKIDLYFQSLYKEHEQDNKVDFFDRLISIILDLVEQFNKHKENYINDKADMLDIQRALSIEGKTFSKRTLDSIQNLNWDKIPFHYENGKIWEIERVNSVKIYEFDIRNLLRGVESFRLLLNTNGSIELNDSNKITINWDIKSKNHLYYTLNQFKKIGLINNTYSELAKFVKQNFPIFDEDETRIMEAIEDQKKAPKRGTLETEKIINDIR